MCMHSSLWPCTVSVSVHSLHVRRWEQAMPTHCKVPSRHCRREVDCHFWLWATSSITPTSLAMHTLLHCCLSTDHILSPVVYVTWQGSVSHWGRGPSSQRYVPMHTVTCGCVNCVCTCSTLCMVAIHTTCSMALQAWGGGGQIAPSLTHSCAFLRLISCYTLHTLPWSQYHSYVPPCLSEHHVHRMCLKCQVIASRLCWECQE